MTKRFKTVSDLQGHLKSSIKEAIETEIKMACIEVVQAFLDEKVYKNPMAGYVPKSNSEWAYDRTEELKESVTVGNFKMGTKYATFEIFMDTEKIHPYETDEGEWNQHANLDFSEDTSEYIPMWIEDGTHGSLWDWRPAQYMYSSYKELGDNKLLAKMLAHALRQRGWDVTIVT